MTAENYDAVIAGASIGGLVTAAVLANRGLRVAVTDPLQQPGSRWGSTNYQGYWINWGHRDGHGISDLMIAEKYLQRASSEAGITIPIKRGGYGDRFRVHSLPDGTARELTYHQMLSRGNDTSAYRLAVDIYGRSSLTEAERDKVAADLQTASGLLSEAGQDGVDRTLVSLTEWMSQHGISDDVRVILINQAESTACSPGEEASVGRLAAHRAAHISVPGPTQDPEAGGMQTIVQAFTRRITELGGDLYLGWKPFEVLTGADDQVIGLVAINQSNLVREFACPVVVTDYPGWELPSLIDRQLLPPQFIERAEAVRESMGDVAGWVAGLNRLPSIRATGEVDDNPSWNRIIYGAGPIKRYHGGWHFPSLHQDNTAPEGKHLLHMAIGHPSIYRGWREIKHAIDVNVSYIGSFYADLDDCVEWSHDQYVTAPQVEAWYLKTVKRHPVKVPTVTGLYCASATAETQGGWASAEIDAALQVLDLLAVEMF